MSRSVIFKERKYLVMAPTGMKLLARGITGLGTGDMSKRMDYSRASMEGLSISMAIDLATQESSGNGSSITQRGSNVNLYEGMRMFRAPDAPLVQTFVNSNALYMKNGVRIEGAGYANFREVGGYDSSKDAVVSSLNFLGSRAGVAANNSSTTDMEVDLSYPNLARMALSGLATVNQTIVDQIRAGM